MQPYHLGWLHGRNRLLATYNCRRCGSQQPVCWLGILLAWTGLPSWPHECVFGDSEWIRQLGGPIRINRR